MNILLVLAALLLLLPLQTLAQEKSDERPFSRSVMQFGAAGDGTTDDTAAFQKAIDTAAEEGGGVVEVPVGNYLIKTGLTVKPYVTLKGILQSPGRSSKGSTLLAVHGKGAEDGDPFITLLEQAGLNGITVSYPEQTAEDPQPYPWCVRGIGDNCTIRNVLLLNPWQGVDFGTNPAGRHFIDGLYMQALKTGVFIDKCFDVGRVNNVHIWPFWNNGPGMEKWHQENTTGFIIGRTDWEYMNNCFTIWCKVGFHFVANADGPGNAVLSQCGADIGPVAVLVDAVQGHSGVSFQNGQFMAGIEVKPTNSGPVKFTACGFWGVAGLTEYHARLEGSGQVSFSNCHFTMWDQKASGAPAIDAVAGGLTLMGCDFMDADKMQVRLGKDVAAAVITGNRFRGGQKIENQAGGSTEIGLNAKQ